MTPVESFAWESKIEDKIAETRDGLSFIDALKVVFLPSSPLPSEELRYIWKSGVLDIAATYVVCVFRSSVCCQDFSDASQGCDSSHWDDRHIRLLCEFCPPMLLCVILSRHFLRP